MTYRKRIVYVIPSLIILIVFLLGFTSNTVVAAKFPENIEPKVDSSIQARQHG